MIEVKKSCALLGCRRLEDDGQKASDDVVEALRMLWERSESRSEK